MNTYDKWAMQADLSELVGGENWTSRQWTSRTLAFYNRGHFAEWLASQVVA